MKIVSIKKIAVISPQGSGTGYSEPDVFKVTANDNGKTFTRNTIIDIWYRPIKDFRAEFIEGIYRSFGNILENGEESFQMWAKETLKDYYIDKDEFEKIYGFSY